MTSAVFRVWEIEGGGHFFSVKNRGKVAKMRSVLYLLVVGLALTYAQEPKRCGKTELNPNYLDYSCLQNHGSSFPLICSFSCDVGGSCVSGMFTRKHNSTRQQNWAHSAISNSVNCPKAGIKYWDLIELVESERCAENELMMCCSFCTCRWIRQRRLIRWASSPMMPRTCVLGLSRKWMKASREVSMMSSFFSGR